MAYYFLDSSATVKRYVKEVGTGWLQSLTVPLTENKFFLAHITLVETVSAIARREKAGSLASVDTAVALANLQYDFSHQYRIVEISDVLILHATALAKIHALRGYDAVQLAAALEVRVSNPSVIFISADNDLNAAAQAEGLTVENPNAH